MSRRAQRRRAVALGLASTLLAFAAVRSTAGAQSPVGGLRLAQDASGQELPPEQVLPGETQYRLPAGVDQFWVAFECLSPSDTDAQVRIMQPPGAILDQKDTSCAAGGTQVLEFAMDRPLDDNEYVANLYVYTPDNEVYLADSLQFAVGSAVIPEGQPEATAPSVEEPTQAAPPPATTSAVVNSAPVDGAGGPSTWLLAVAGLGILALVGVVLWAGVSAMRS